MAWMLWLVPFPCAARLRGCSGGGTARGPGQRSRVDVRPGFVLGGNPFCPSPPSPGFRGLSAQASTSPTHPVGLVLPGVGRSRYLSAVLGRPAWCARLSSSSQSAPFAGGRPLWCRSPGLWRSAASRPGEFSVRESASVCRPVGLVHDGGQGL